LVTTFAALVTAFNLLGVTSGSSVTAFKITVYTGDTHGSS
jgi:hypothetical protein